MVVKNGPMVPGAETFGRGWRLLPVSAVPVVLTPRFQLA